MMLHLPVYSVFLSSSHCCHFSSFVIYLVIRSNEFEIIADNLGNLFELIDDEGNVRGHFQMSVTLAFATIGTTSFTSSQQSDRSSHLTTPSTTWHTGLFIFDEGETIYGWADDRHTYESIPKPIHAKSPLRSGQSAQRFWRYETRDGYPSFRRSESTSTTNSPSVYLQVEEHNFYYAEYHLFFSRSSIQ